MIAPSRNSATHDRAILAVAAGPRRTRWPRVSDGIRDNRAKEWSMESYVLPATDLAMGASLGNSAVWVTMKSTGAIERIFSARVGASMFGAGSVRYAFCSQPVDGIVAPQRRDRSAAVPVEPEGPTSVELHPAYQRRRFSLPGGVEVSETMFVPLSAQAEHDTGDPAAAYLRVELHNAGAVSRTLRIVASARLRGAFAPDVAALFNDTIGALVATNASRPGATRCFGSTVPRPDYGTTTDVGRAYDPSHLHAFENDTSATGDVLGALQHEIALEPGASNEVAFLCAALDAEPAAAVEAYRALPPPAEALAATIAHLADVVRIGEPATPNASINAGARWSKVNMRRVMSDYESGRAFTNEPGVSSNVVGRDAAWFVYGNDHFLPAFSRALLDTFARLQYPSGKIPEYYNALDESVEDDGLNINDDTPLFILAVNHHFRATGDVAWLQTIFRASRARPATSSRSSTTVGSRSARRATNAATYGRSRAGATSSRATR